MSLPSHEKNMKMYMMSKGTEVYDVLGNWGIWRQRKWGISRQGESGTSYQRKCGISCLWLQSKVDWGNKSYFV